MLIKVFPYSFSEALATVFNRSIKVILSLSDHYKIFSTDWSWIEVSQNVVLSKIDTTMTAINKKLWNQLKPIFARSRHAIACARLSVSVDGRKKRTRSEKNTYPHSWTGFFSLFFDPFSPLSWSLYLEQVICSWKSDTRNSYVWRALPFQLGDEEPYIH